MIKLLYLSYIFILDYTNICNGIYTNIIKNVMFSIKSRFHYRSADKTKIFIITLQYVIELINPYIYKGFIDFAILTK